MAPTMDFVAYIDLPMEVAMARKLRREVSGSFFASISISPSFPGGANQMPPREHLSLWEFRRMDGGGEPLCLPALKSRPWVGQDRPGGF